MQATPGAVAGFLKNAESFFALSKSLLAGAPLATEPMQIFTNAYEGYHQVVQAVLEFYEVRTKEAARAMAIQRWVGGCSGSGHCGALACNRCSASGAAVASKT